MGLQLLDCFCSDKEGGGNNALLMALWRRKFPSGVVGHSDRALQYCSHDYQKMIKNMD